MLNCMASKNISVSKSLLNIVTLKKYLYKLFLKACFFHSFIYYKLVLALLCIPFKTFVDA